CSLLENAGSDLEYLARQFEKDLGMLQGVDQISAIEKLVEDHNAARDTEREKLAKIEKDIESLDGMIEEANEKLRNAAAAAQLQAQREQQEARLLVLQDEIKQTDGEVVQWIGGKALALASRRLSGEAATFIESESLHGRIPS